MKKIQLGGRYKKKISGYALIDDEDFNELSKYKWHLAVGYAKCGVQSKGKWRNISMHQVIMSTPKGMDTDHIDGNRLNNQKANLRICTHAQNNHNSKIPRNNTTGFKGVVFHRNTKKFMAQIAVNKKRIYLGLFSSLKEAALAYNEGAKKYFGEFANLNIL